MPQIPENNNQNIICVTQVLEDLDESASAEDSFYVSARATDLLKRASVTVDVRQALDDADWDAVPPTPHPPPRPPHARPTPEQASEGAS